MKKIIDYFKLLLLYSKKSLHYYMLFFVLATVLCLFIMSSQEKNEFWQNWAGYDNNFPATIMSLKLLFMSCLFLFVDALDIRQTNSSFYYYVVSRYVSKRKLDTKINVLLTIVLTIVFWMYYSLLAIYIYSYNNALPTLLVNYIIIEYINFIGVMILYKTLHLTSGSVLVSVVSLIHMFLPIKLPLLTSFVSVDKVYNIGVYCLSLVAVTILCYTLGGRKYDTNRKLM